MGSVLYDIFKKNVDNSNYLPSANNIEESGVNKNDTTILTDNKLNSNIHNHSKPNGLNNNDMIFLFATLTAFLCACCLLMSCTNHYLIKKVMKLRHERRVREENEQNINQVSVTETSKKVYDIDIKKSYLDTVD
uniref:Plasmodium vivax Vir protein n=1 Tax=Strongyloides venezuelensis TaxID=75913 RepID=A0A0K0FI27_STRVS